MDSMSVSDDFDMTREEENSLLQVNEDMATESPLKTSDTQTPIVRKPIVFDLNGSQDSAADDDNDNENEMRDKFRSERKTIVFAPSDPSRRRQIPDSLNFIKGRDLVELGIRSQRKRGRKRMNRERNRSVDNDMSRMRGQSNRGIPHNDLRHFIGSSSERMNAINYNHQSVQSLQALQSLRANHSLFNTLPNQLNPMLYNNPGMGLTPLMDWQLGLGILNPNVIPNQVLLNALLAQNAANPLLNRLQMQNPSIGDVPNIPINKPKDDIQITIVNNNESRNSSRTHTRPQIRCLVPKESQSSGSDVNEFDMPSMAPPIQQKPELKTLFSKHLKNKAIQSKATAQQSTGSNNGSDLFCDALAEAEVGVDNEYLIRMKEIEKKRLELQKLKEQRRMEMADQRLQSALDVKSKISNQKYITID